MSFGGSCHLPWSISTAGARLSIDLAPPEAEGRSLDHEHDTVDLSSLRGWRLLQMRLWLIMDHPRTSKLAMMYGITSFLFVAASIAGFCLETLPGLRPEIMPNITNTSCGGEQKKLHVIQTSNEALNVLDFTCTVFFTLELLLRFCVSPNKRQFVLSPMNIIDLLALVPLYVQVVFEQSNLQSCYMNERFVIEIMFILRIFRMFRIFHLVKHYQALKVLVYALRASLQELLMLFIFLLIAMLIFATMIYYAERSDDFGAGSEFSTIPIGFWWAIITMTTVGYGDVTPSTPVGYMVGTACSVCGVLLVALTFPVISNNFSLFYEHVRSRSLSPRVREPPDGVNYNEYEVEINGDDHFGFTSPLKKDSNHSHKEDEDLGFLRDHPPLYGSVSVSSHRLPPNSTTPDPLRRHSHAGPVRSASPTDMNGKAKASTAHKFSKSPSAGYIPLAKFTDSDIVKQVTTLEESV
ncbi:potassium voltage-gated channel subfamily C member 1 [Elysia marginata]|uniref:Potassium voltage-gated channel subfamily C member 1 n=1 Tax=Elysia marginata TaxID=1093978 RepID=A0AAV4JV85_9GAST|nr:potassium voltage-gated channel subfamily C member 1 [Elysia marginata]